MSDDIKRSLQILSEAAQPKAPGAQVKGKERASKYSSKKGHPFKGRLVGGESVEPNLNESDLKSRLEKFRGDTGGWVQINPDEDLDWDKQIQRAFRGASEVYEYDDDEGGYYNPGVIVGEKSGRYIVGSASNSHNWKLKIFPDIDSAIKFAADEGNIWHDDSVSEGNITEGYESRVLDILDQNNIDGHFHEGVLYVYDEEDVSRAEEVLMNYPGINMPTISVEDPYDSGPEDMDGDFDSAMASAGHGSDEDYGDYGGYEESAEQPQRGTDQGKAMYDMGYAQGKRGGKMSTRVKWNEYYKGYEDGKKEREGHTNEADTYDPTGIKHSDFAKDETNLQMQDDHEFSNLQDWERAVAARGLHVDSSTGHEGPHPSDVYNYAHAMDDEGNIYGHFGPSETEGDHSGVLFRDSDSYMQYVYEPNDDDYDEAAWRSSSLHREHRDRVESVIEEIEQDGSQVYRVKNEGLKTILSIKGADGTESTKDIAVEDWVDEDIIRSMHRQWNDYVKEVGGEPQMFTQLSDAGPNYAPGPAEIWYWKSEYSRDLMMGPSWLQQHRPELMPTPETIDNTHVLIGTLNENDPEKIYMMMQGESWSPEGQARNMIQQSGTGHTSMSMGDIIKRGSDMWMVDSFGFWKVGDPTESVEEQVATKAVKVSDVQQAIRHLQQLAKGWELDKEDLVRQADSKDIRRVIRALEQSKIDLARRIYRNLDTEVRDHFFPGNFSRNKEGYKFTPIARTMARIMNVELNEAVQEAGPKKKAQQPKTDDTNLESLKMVLDNGEAGIEGEDYHFDGSNIVAHNIKSAGKILRTINNSGLFSKQAVVIKKGEEPVLGFDTAADAKTVFTDEIGPDFEEVHVEVKTDSSGKFYLYTDGRRNVRTFDKLAHAKRYVAKLDQQLRTSEQIGKVTHPEED